jgi:hypothetical protein
MERYPELSNYGRFAICTDQTFWFFETVDSSHPANIKYGFYWAISSNGVIVSARGAGTDIERFQQNEYGMAASLMLTLKRRRLVVF